VHAELAKFLQFPERSNRIYRFFQGMRCAARSLESRRSISCLIFAGQFFKSLLLTSGMMLVATFKAAAVAAILCRWGDARGMQLGKKGGV
jgi:hypothetical protein